LSKFRLFHGSFVSFLTGLSGCRIRVRPVLQTGRLPGRTLRFQEGPGEVPFVSAHSEAARVLPGDLARCAFFHTAEKRVPEEDADLESSAGTLPAADLSGFTENARLPAGGGGSALPDESESRVSADRGVGTGIARVKNGKDYKRGEKEYIEIAKKTAEAEAVPWS
jgi:hypothetical protein